MKHIFLTFLLVFLSLFSIYGVPLTASWVDGDVTMKVGSSWQEINTGDTVDSGTVVRVGSDSMAEFTSGSQKVAFSSPGTYNLENLLKTGNVQEQKRSGVLNQLSRLVDKQAPRSTVVAGVRGDFEGNSDKTEWAVDENDPQTLADEGQKLLASKKYADAAASFGDAAAQALGDQRDEYRYNQAWCLAMSDNLIAAIKILRPMNASGPYSIPRGILLARLSLDTGAPKEAASLLDEISANPSLVGDDAALVKQMKEEAAKAIGAIK